MPIVLIDVSPGRLVTPANRMRNDSSSNMILFSVGLGNSTDQGDNGIRHGSANTRSRFNPQMAYDKAGPIPSEVLTRGLAQCSGGFQKVRKSSCPVGPSGSSMLNLSMVSSNGSGEPSNIHFLSICIAVPRTDEGCWSSVRRGSRRKDRSSLPWRTP